MDINLENFADKHAEYKIQLFKEMVSLFDEECLSDELIQKAEINCGFSKNYYHILFPLGKVQILQEFESWQDQVMFDKLEQCDNPIKIRQKISLALEVRIMDIISKEASLNINAFFVMNPLCRLKLIYRTCDLIWKYAGDKSTDFNYYTKRSLLASVYMSTLAFYLADSSENHEDTKEFIKNSLDNIINIAKFKNRISLPKIEDIPILRLFS